MPFKHVRMAVQHGCPVKVILSNSGCVGMVRQWQELHYDGCYCHSYSEALPDFVAAQTENCFPIRATGLCVL